MIDIKGLNKQQIMSGLIKNAVIKNQPLLRYTPALHPGIFQLTYATLSLATGSRFRPGHPVRMLLPSLEKALRTLLTQQQNTRNDIMRRHSDYQLKVSQHNGTPINVDLTGDAFDTRAYNDRYGPGEAERIVNIVRRMH
ncbi:hypothetical protein [Neorickettsia helminthoeca]|uniref:hypothetical protein n=1 Tax=Neorickettsia helminthoeca TaxID=33994 RepID=UPI00056E2FAB|nr:hypothetical protein [Neorickettsia helminthoeca]